LKTHPKVAEALALAEEKAKELTAARAAVQRIEREVFAAHAAVRAAQTAVDETLPQASMVKVFVRSGNSEDMGRVVIVRRTPGGLLITRPVGEPSGISRSFRWSTARSCYVEKVKAQSYVSSVVTLSDVPAEFANLNPKAA
jgi:hypothetical protein